MNKTLTIWLFGFFLIVVLLLLAFAIYFCPEKTPEWISAFAAVVSAFGVIFVWQQLQETGEIARLQFEDGLAKEYRELIGRIPTKSMLGVVLSPAEFAAAFDELFRYIDLSNEQVMLRKNERISVEVWSNWRDGISSNFELPAFKKAWQTVQQKMPSQFSELNRLFEELEKLEGETDPAKWDKK